MNMDKNELTDEQTAQVTGGRIIMGGDLNTTTISTDNQ